MRCLFDVGHPGHPIRDVINVSNEILCLSMGTYFVIAVMVLNRCIAFSRTAAFHTTRHVSTIRLWSATAATDSGLNTPTCNDNLATFNPLGPPSFLANLPIGETFYLSSLDKNITRLSSMPDIFVVRDFISTNEGEKLMQSTLLRGMKIAGTRNSGVDTIRKGSYLAWIDPYGFDGEREATTIARKAIVKSRLCFAHESMNDLMNNPERLDYAFAEDMQIAKYDAGGRFDCHHDGFGRYLTVLAYLNGAGGTYFPFGGMCIDELDGIDFTNENEVSAMAVEKRVGKCGVLIVGKEGADSYLDSTSLNPKTIIEIQAGDAIAFYNYSTDGTSDFRSLHCGLTVPEEKWIATCWFRSEALTGPFSSMKKTRLFEEWCSTE